MKALILTFIPATDFTLLSGEGDLIEYRFNTKKLGHKSCKACGVQVYATGKGKGDVDTVALNLRCIDNIALKEFIIHPYNGKDV